MHANFIENRSGCCTASDITNLAKLCRRRVYEKFGVWLSFEIQFLGFDRRSMEDDALA